MMRLVTELTVFVLTFVIFFINSCCYSPLIVVSASIASGTGNRESSSSHRSAKSVPIDEPISDDPLIVRTKNGLVRGFSMMTLGHEVHVFEGIPFAKPPIGPLRFRKPVPVDDWTGILNATKKPNTCFQESYDYFPGFVGEEMWNANTELSEDCLYLSIWVPQKLRIRHHSNGSNGDTPKRKIPVFVWIYGGGYISGTCTLDVYTSSILASYNNAVVACMQYRVGSFGFLYLTPLLSNGNTDAPGNMGLWDQRLAIIWLKENIQAFGGDPDHITLFGESAGAGSVSVHLLSPASRHLFNRGILQSGTVNAPWSYMTGEKAAQIALTLIDDCGCNASLIMENAGRVMSCMRKVDAKVISKRQWNSYWGILGFPTAPTIDGVFLTKDPIEMVRETDFTGKEVIIGSNLNEGTYFLLYDFIDYFQKDEPSALDRHKFLEVLNTIFKDASPLEREAIIFQYTDWENIYDGYLNQQILGDLVGDYFFVCPNNLFASAISDQGAVVYYYYFTQRTSSNPWGEWMGVIHADEIAYVFGEPMNVSNDYNARERDLSIRIMQSFLRFAINGKPTPDDLEWPRYTTRNPIYYLLSTVRHGTGKGPRATACQFWNEFMPKVQTYVDSNMKGCGLIKADKKEYNMTNGVGADYMADMIVLAVTMYYAVKHVIRV